MKMIHLTMVLAKKVSISSDPANVLLSYPNACLSNICSMNMRSFFDCSKNAISYKVKKGPDFRSLFVVTERSASSVSESSAAQQKQENPAAVVLSEAESAAASVIPAAAGEKQQNPDQAAASSVSAEKSGISASASTVALTSAVGCCNITHGFFLQDYYLHFIL